MLHTKHNRLFLLAAFAIFSFSAVAQTQTPAKKHKFAIYAGVGPNIYFNNLVIAKEYVKEINYSFAGRFMWEPEHLLSLGIESGYYRLYHMDFGSTSDVKITNSAIPIQFILSMRMLKHFYFNFNYGQSILKNNISNAGENNTQSSVISLGDFSGSLGYRYDWKERFTLSAESKFFYSSKLNDKNIALLFLIGYKL
jgi:hypothetical protein